MSKVHIHMNVALTLEIYMDIKRKAVEGARSVRSRMLLSTIAGVSALLSFGGHAHAVTYPAPAVGTTYKHVLLISVDGLHASDLSNWIENHRSGNIAKLASHGIIYPNAFTTAPSDSYPG